MRVVNVGVIGAGIVGTGVVRNLLKQRRRLAEQTGASVRLAKVCTRHRSAIHRLRVRPSLWTRDVQLVTRDPQVDIVAELVGGTSAAKTYVLDALRHGKHVVTANKALLAEHGRELERVAQRYHVALRYEAAVAGGVPIIKALRESLVGNDIDTVLGIVNGTSNYILTQMARHRTTFSAALKEAQQRGYAERNPRLDINGRDAAHKLAILAQLAFGCWVPQRAIHVEGIQQVEPLDLAYAAELGYVIKPVAIAKRVEGSLEMRVHPTLLARDHVLANVRGVFNGIYVHGDMVGSQLFYGRGAGQRPTASAVVADIAELAQRVAGGCGEQVVYRATGRNQLRVRPIGKIEGRYYLRCTVLDRPGVLAQLARILGQYHISISSVSQPEHGQARAVPIIIMTHEALERHVHQALAALTRLHVVKKQPVALRIETPT